MKLNIRELKSRADNLAEANRKGTRSLVLLYCGVIAALTLGSSGLNLYLNDQISGTGGLGGLAMRSVLQTIQELLTYVNLFFTPVWSAGFLMAMIYLVRGGAPEKKQLMSGFHRFGRILAYIAFQFLVTLMLLVAAINVGVTLFALSPMGKEYAEVMGPILTDPNIVRADGLVNWELLPMATFLRSTLPVLAVCLVIFSALYIFLSYNFRLTMYLIMTQPIGAVRAHFVSMRLMRGHKWQMLKLDLSWWWYYLLLTAASAVAYLDVILELVGIPAPFGSMVMFFATLVVYCVLFTALSLWKKCPVDASYALAYESIAAAALEDIPARAE